MKTITHKLDERGVQYATIHFGDGRDYGFRSSQYALGWCKPNYPMPAIPLAVLHTPDYVLIATPDYWEGELMEFIIVAEFNRE